MQDTKNIYRDARHDARLSALFLGPGLSLGAFPTR